MKQLRHRVSRGVLALCALVATDAAHAGDNLMDALTKGKVDFYARLRYEFVEDGAFARTTPAPAVPLEDADAFTLRTTLGYNTGLFHGVGAYLQFEDVRAIVEDYNDGSFTVATNGLTSNARFATVVDPEGTEVQQANLRYEGLPYTVLRVGRQEIEHRGAPLHRYIGNILWRQNWQGFDAARVTTSFFPDVDTGDRRLKLDYAYVWNTNRIFGEDNPIRDRSDFPMNSHFFKVNWDGLSLVKLEGYVYSLDFDHSVSRQFSTNTVGLRGEGAKGLGPKWKILYTGEFAHQGDAYDNPADIDVNYYLGEAGVAYQFGKKWLDTVTVKGSYEVLEGDGTVSGIGRAFQTPLGTNHAFQGWADRFLITPGDGIEDLFGTLRVTGYGATFIAMYHDFSSNNDDYSYGTEWDLVAEKPLKKNWLVGLKYSDYDASDDALNQARNRGGGQAFDLIKFWVYVQFKF